MPPIIVQKFGGTCVKDAESIVKVAKIIKKTMESGLFPVVVVSAMAGTTSRLIESVMSLLSLGLGRGDLSEKSADLASSSPVSPPTQEYLGERTFDTWVESGLTTHWAQGFNHIEGLDQPPYTSWQNRAEGDAVIATGEQVSAGLLAIALGQLGVSARSWMGWQIPIITSGVFANATITSIDTRLLRHEIREGRVPIITGFQGMTPEGRISTLGRGGSDTTASAVAAFLGAQWCEIFTDVAGVYSADPRLVSQATAYEVVSYQDMLTFSRHGAKVLHPACVSWAQSHNIPIHVRCAQAPEQKGTWIRAQAPAIIGVTKIEAISWHISLESPDKLQSITIFLEGCAMWFLKWPLDAQRWEIVTPPALFSPLSQHLKDMAVAHTHKSVSLITLLGPKEAQDRILRGSNALIYRYFQFQKTLGLMTDAQNSPHVLRSLHNALLGV